MHGQNHIKLAFITSDFDSLLRIIEQWSNFIQMLWPILHSIKSA